MGSNPLNLAVRFLLEIWALISTGIWGWQQSENWPKFVLGLGIPFILAAVWGTFAVPDDPSRSGNAPVPVPGYLRLVIELIIFSIAIWALYDLGYSKLSWIMGLMVFVHYVISYDRILWLFRH